MTPSMLNVKNLCHTFSEDGEKVHALRGVSFTAEKSTVTSIVGPSGCGKSTLMYLLGLLDRPDSGDVIFKGKPVSKLNDFERTKYRNEFIGFIFQFHFLIKELTAVENVALPALKLGISNKEAHDNASDILKKLGLNGKINRLANKLSGGEQQRVAIARAMINSPSLLLADEPTGNLDTENSNMVFDVLVKMAKEKEIAVILVTHNRELANRCDRVIEMKDGLISN